MLIMSTYPIMAGILFIMTKERESGMDVHLRQIKVSPVTQACSWLIIGTSIIIIPFIWLIIMLKIAKITIYISWGLLLNFAWTFALAMLGMLLVTSRCSKRFSFNFLIFIALQTPQWFIAVLKPFIRQPWRYLFVFLKLNASQL